MNLNLNAITLNTKKNIVNMNIMPGPPKKRKEKKKAFHVAPLHRTLKSRRGSALP